MPPLMGEVAPGTGLDQNAQGGGGDARQVLEEIMGKIRGVGESVTALGQAVPAFAPDIQQIQKILRRLVVKAAQRAPQQDASAAQLPTGG